MPEMPDHFKALFQSPLYGVVARRVVLPWALQGLRPSGEGLELGSGGGAMAARLLARFRNLRLVATDFDPEMVAATREVLRPYGDRATVQAADATALPFPDQRFDVVFAFAIFHHSGAWDRAIAESVRVLRPGGRLVGYDMLEGAPMHGGRGHPRSEVAAAHSHHGSVGHGHQHEAEPEEVGKMIRSAQQLERQLETLPLNGILVRRSPRGVAVRFLATRSANPSA
ncbi:MAG: class I SAM-dependent methyltransferase [Candidatus Dormibacteraeota bacterium]|nr:class I SAM-dependent methyltransferase [Candidatus Dormibacteraeota bacterium]